MHSTDIDILYNTPEWAINIYGLNSWKRKSFDKTETTILFGFRPLTEENLCWSYKPLEVLKKMCNNLSKLCFPSLPTFNDLKKKEKKKKLKIDSCSAQAWFPLIW